LGPDWVEKEALKISNTVQTKNKLHEGSKKGKIVAVKNIR
jgi:hypothetical protein